MAAAIRSEKILLSTLTNIIVIHYFAAGSVASTEVAASDGQRREYCQWDTFEARCPTDDEVILITDAVYGRMAYGRCIRPEYGYVGCQANVHRLAAAQCSGRHHCQIHVPDKLLDATRPCREDLKNYLLIGYTCVKVTLPIGGVCRNTVESGASTGVEGLLSSAVSAQTGCGSPTTPWMIDVQPGQRINISLVDFGAPPLDNTSTTTSRRVTSRVHCQVYAVIKERVLGGQGVTVCGRNALNARAISATQSEEEVVYLSDSNSVEIRVIAARSTKDDRQFLLRYRAVGCAGVIPPRNVWWKRNAAGSNATFGCADMSLPAQQMICVGNEWRSDTSPDSIDCPDPPQTGSLLSALMPVSHSFTVILILCIASTVGLLIFVAGMCVIQSRRRAAAASKRQNVLRQLSAGQRAPYIKDEFQTAPAYMSRKCDNQSLYPYAVSSAAGGGQCMLPCRPPYPGGSVGDGDECSWRSTGADNEYAYVEDLLPPPSSMSRHQSPAHVASTPATNNNNTFGGQATSRPTAHHPAAGYLLLPGQYDMAPDARN